MDAGFKGEGTDEKCIGPACLDRFESGLLNPFIVEGAEFRTDADTHAEAIIGRPLDLNVRSGELVEAGKGYPRMALSARNPLGVSIATTNPMSAKALRISSDAVAPMTSKTAHAGSADNGP